MTVAKFTLFFFMTVLFSRLLSNLGGGALINFLHFPFIFILAIVILFKARGGVAKRFVHSILLFIFTVAFSGVVNGAGLVNVILEILILIEPLLFIFCLLSIQWSRENIKYFRNGLFLTMAVHALFIIYQYFLLGYTDDGVVGILLGVGAGAHLSGAIALSFAVYLYLYKIGKNGDIPSGASILYSVSILFFVASVWFSDAKQVFAVFLVALGLLSLINVSDAKKSFYTVFALIVASFFLYGMAQTIFPALQTWAKLDILEEGIDQKHSVFLIISSYYSSSLSYLFGLGPGHSVGRLAMLMPEYSGLLSTLGATTTLATIEVWVAHQGHYMSNATTGSSMFSLFFSWAGIWGDIGLLGLAVYMYMYYLVWDMVSSDDFSKFLLLTVFVFGWVFQWMEEPQYMIFIMSLIGLRWQENQLNK